MSKTIYALIAAAGQSRRMGFPKALMLIQGEIALALLTHVFARSYIAKIFVTLPHSLINDSQIHAMLADYPVKIIANRYEHEGYAGSIITLIEKLRQERENYDGLFITPVDAPYASKELIQAMVSFAGLGSKNIIVPMYYASAGHPVYVSQEYFSKLTKNSCFHSLRIFLSEHKSFVKKLYWPNAQVLANVNSGAQKIL